jgi:hypothetical protein
MHWAGFNFLYLLQIGPNLFSSQLGLLLTGPQLNAVFNLDRQICAEMRIGFDLNALLYLCRQMLFKYVLNKYKAQIFSYFNSLNS